MPFLVSLITNHSYMLYQNYAHFINSNQEYPRRVKAISSFFGNQTAMMSPLIYRISCTLSILFATVDLSFQSGYITPLSISVPAGVKIYPDTTSSNQGLDKANTQTGIGAEHDGSSSDETSVPDTGLTSVPGLLFTKPESPSGERNALTSRLTSVQDIQQQVHPPTAQFPHGYYKGQHISAPQVVQGYSPSSDRKLVSYFGRSRTHVPVIGIMTFFVFICWGLNHLLSKGFTICRTSEKPHHILSKC